MKNICGIGEQPFQRLPLSERAITTTAYMAFEKWRQCLAELPREGLTWDSRDGDPIFVADEGKHASVHVVIEINAVWDPMRQDCSQLIVLSNIECGPVFHSTQKEDEVTKKWIAELDDMQATYGDKFVIRGDF